MLNLKDQYGRPSDFALTIAMEGIKNEIIKGSIHASEV